MGKKKIEPTDAMVEAVEHARKFLVLDVRTILRAALNHPDAPGLFVDEECAQCRLLNTAWHDLAHHPAIVPPNWEPGNGQSYAEAVLDHLNSRSGEDDRPWEPLNGPVRVGDEVRREWRRSTRIAVVGRVDEDGDPWTADGALIGILGLGTWYVRRTVQELPTEPGSVIVPADGCDYIESTLWGETFYARAALRSWTGWYAAWRAGERKCGLASSGEITPGTWKVDDQ